MSSMSVVVTAFSLSGSRPVSRSPTDGRHCGTSLSRKRSSRVTRQVSSGSTSKARDLLTPTGEIAVVGCAANRTVRDWVLVGEVLPDASVRRALYYRYLLR